MVFKFMTFDIDDEFLNNHPGSPPYYGPCPSSSSADSSPAVSFCNCCLAGVSVSGLPDVAEPSATGQRFSAPFQVVQQSQNRDRSGNNFLLKLIYRRTRYHSNRGDGNKSMQKSHDKQGTSTEQQNGGDKGVEMPREKLPREMSKHTGFAFDSPGYESFFASQQGVYAPQKAWDVVQRASMRTKAKLPPKK